MRHDSTFEFEGKVLDVVPFPYGKGFERCKECIAHKDAALCERLPTCGGKKPIYFVEHELTFEELFQ